MLFEVAMLRKTTQIIENGVVWCG